MKLLATTSFLLTKDINVGLILNQIWSRYSLRECANSKQAIQDIFEYVDAGYTNWNLANTYNSVKDLISNFPCQLINQSSNYCLSPLHAFTKWVSSSNQTSKHSGKKGILIFGEKINRDSLELSQLSGQKYGNNLSFLQQIARFRSGTW